MNLKRTAIPDVKVLCPKKFEDKRGFFSETFNKEVDKLIAGAVVQNEEVLHEINTQIDEQAVSLGEFEAEKIETPAEEVKEEE